MTKIENRLPQIVLGAAIFFFVGCWSGPGPGNYKTAYIRKSGQSFTLMVKGRRSYHPSGLFGEDTYEDSCLYIIPRDSGIIKPEELPFEKGHYPYSSTGSITIKSRDLKIDLYFNDTDEKKIRPVSWNGDYDLMKGK